MITDINFNAYSIISNSIHFRYIVLAKLTIKAMCLLENAGAIL